MAEPSTPDEVMDVCVRMFRALGITPDDAAAMSDADRLAVLELIAADLEAQARQRAHGRTGAAMRAGTAWQRRKRDAEILATVRQIGERHPDWSGREVQRHAGRIHGISDRAVRACIERLKKGGNAGLPPASPA